MGKIISAFEAGSRYGGGVVTRRLFELFKSTHKTHLIRCNAESKIFRIFRMIFIWIKAPMLHPIFCMYAAKPDAEFNLLNFSQTFNLVARYPSKKFSLVVHDVIIQKRMIFNGWIKNSEKRLFSQADKIYVLSDKDRRLIRRFYKIDDGKIINLFASLFPNLRQFHKYVCKKNKYRALFIGSLKRRENYLGFEWFYKNVYSYCMDSVEVTCLGETDDEIEKDFNGVSFLGFIEDINKEVMKFDFTIAPIVEGAGIKIKVVDSLTNMIPVIGTPKAFEGLGRPSLPYCTNDPANWISVIKGDIISYEYMPPI